MGIVSMKILYIQVAVDIEFSKQIWLYSEIIILRLVEKILGIPLSENIFLSGLARFCTLFTVLPKECVSGILVQVSRGRCGLLKYTFGYNHKSQICTQYWE